MAKGNKGQQSQQVKKTTTATANTETAATNIEAGKSFFNNRALLSGILAMAVLLAFISGFGNEFINYDDNAYVTQNPYVQHPTFANLLLLLRVECAFNYHPLTMITYWLNAVLFGTGPVSFIVTNTLLHIINTLLVFFFTAKLTKGNNWLAFFIALLWGVHPLRVESVTWISERKDVLYTFFFLLSCIRYVYFIERGKQKYLVYSFILFLLSCLAKGMAVVLPLVLVLLDYWFDNDWLSIKRFLQKIPFFIVSFLFGMLTIAVQSGSTLGGFIIKMSTAGDSAIHSKLSFIQKFCYGFTGFWVYIIKTIIPYNLHNYYVYPRAENYYDAQYIIAPILGIALLLLAIKMYKSQKAFFYGILFFFFTIIIVLQFIAVGDNMLSERYSYIPTLGIIFLVVYWLSTKVKERTLTPILSVVAAVFIFLSFRYAQTYKDTGSVFLNSYKYSPGSTYVNEFVMDYYGEKGDFQTVLDYGQTALENNVASFKIYIRLAKAFYFLGNTEKAQQIWELALPLAPVREKKAVFCERGMMFRSMSKYTESIKDFDSAFYYNSIDHYDVKFKGMTFAERGFAFKMAGENMAAISDFDSAIKLAPIEYDSVIKDKAYAELMVKQWPQAEADYTSMIKQGINKDTAYYNRGCAYYNMGRKQDAISDLEQAVKINPSYQQAKENLAALQQMK